VRRQINKRVKLTPSVVLVLKNIKNRSNYTELGGGGCRLLTGGSVPPLGGCKTYH